MNKYLRRGLILSVSGILIIYGGYWMMHQEIDLYKIIMILGVLVFSWGFVTIIYSLIRKIERKSIIESRQEEQHKD
ncbi:signal peptidase [Sphingobacterium spiritivorum]|uniref:signal peptidase n=1 Tax=Sphingobacterium TaxID=28453 RepID=UPI0019194DDC|nr:MULTISPECIES: signal peptidase [Sphingobacterium]QQT27614.1 signal peptidase [Sphingobacterium spiritivorum]